MSALSLALLPFVVLAHFQASSIVAPGVRVGNLAEERLTRQQLTALVEKRWNKGAAGCR